jgi:hypothetical protein
MNNDSVFSTLAWPTVRPTSPDEQIGLAIQLILHAFAENKKQVEMQNKRLEMMQQENSKLMSEKIRMQQELVKLSRCNAA